MPKRNRNNLRSNEKSGKKGYAKTVSKLSALLWGYRQCVVFWLCSRTWKAWGKEHGELHKMKRKGTAIAPVLEEQDEIHCYVHQSFFAAGPSEGYYTAKHKGERHNYLSAWLFSLGLWSVLQRVTFTALPHCFDSKLTLLLSMVALCCSKSAPQTGIHCYTMHFKFCQTFLWNY